VTWLAERWLKWRGWRFVGEIPDLDRMILVGAPHTTNWDFVVYLAAIRHWQISPRYIAKHTLFRRPFGLFFERFGGIPVDRTRPGGFVGQLAEEFERSDQMILVMAPEGARKAAPYWKSGFLRIASKTGVPIVPVYTISPGRRSCSALLDRSRVTRRRSWTSFAFSSELERASTGRAQGRCV
jgi:1-acyl-sn-glycerol-3-phosphate acyltransferase